MAIHYYDQEVRSGLQQKRKLTAFLHQLIKEKLAIATSTVAYIFCNDEALLEKNVQFLNHDTLTDIITFDLSETDRVLIAEIYISVDRIKENAAAFGVDYQTELHRVIFHGMLHLCGYKDKNKADKTLMTEMENQCLQQYFARI